ncbi:16S rRNA (guanine(966)-N(2))-methyltransferase RsmD [Neisseriaceae bacterium CLB008]|nr:16S rRNA (guanine(966)-N(2))-methyltransferase RsmD [Neisseriaceae bacterium]
MSKQSHKQRNNQVRIIGGSHKRRIIEFPSSEGLRPTPDRVRETLFNWLGQTLNGDAVLDLYAGSGALGLEAKSRGADPVVLVEKSRQVAGVLRQNIDKLGWTSADVQVYIGEAYGFLRSNRQPFNVVLLDPPFEFDDWASLWPLLQASLAPDAYVYIEAARLPALPDYLSEVRQASAGQSKQVLSVYSVSESTEAEC